MAVAAGVERHRGAPHSRPACYLVHMWKKVLAALCIPVWLFFLFWMLRTIQALVVAGPKGKDAWLVYLMVVGMLVVLFWLLFFLGRWIWRVLFQRKKPVRLEWPE